MIKDIDYTKLSRGIPRKGQETAEDRRYWKYLLELRDKEWERAKRQNTSGWFIDTNLGTVLEELYAIPSWWLKEQKK